MKKFFSLNGGRYVPSYEVEYSQSESCSQISTYSSVSGSRVTTMSSGSDESSTNKIFKTKNFTFKQMESLDSTATANDSVETANDSVETEDAKSISLNSYPNSDSTKTSKSMTSKSTGSSSNRRYYKNCSCSDSNGNTSISTVFSGFISTVDDTVDLLVDALMPTDVYDETDESMSKELKTYKSENLLDSPRKFMKVLSFSRFMRRDKSFSPSSKTYDTDAVSLTAAHEKPLTKSVSFRSLPSFRRRRSSLKGSASNSSVSSLMKSNYNNNSKIIKPSTTSATATTTETARADTDENSLWNYFLSTINQPFQPEEPEISKVDPKKSKKEGFRLRRMLSFRKGKKESTRRKKKHGYVASE